MDKATLTLLIEEAAPLAGAGPLMAYTDRDAWLLSWDGDTMLDLEHDPAADRVVLAGGIWTPADAARPRVCEMLLQYNYIWTETGGLRMALDGQPGQVVLMFELPATQLNVSRLSTVLVNMVGVQRAWRELLRQIDKAAESGQEAHRQALSWRSRHANQHSKRYHHRRGVPRDAQGHHENRRLSGAQQR